ncbi:CUE domain-containing protein 2 [Hyla sarda]|uniref:CUE domain-containing protein 2 n=1 Tax=Hyla sarda TaxID=327740 RepID=UPI0024C35D3F|nr:CUE domain-containing protein 2 [Hyla sarda]XP_056386533.1 CUE domain-containing protein 2 [Hyla sarda]XP_056386534.1 CUE domain-containing protein 2 [Hyla sarda]
MSREKIIRDALTDFIQSHIPNADVSAMDEVFFSYVTGVLEELGSQDSSDEDFDMETFMEMLEGYIPGFAEIGSEKVYEMMFELSGQLREARSKENCSTETSDPPLMGTECDHIELAENGLHVASEGAEAQEKGKTQGYVDALLEMFPACTLCQAQKVLSMAKGNLEDAVQIIVDGEVTLDPSEPQVLQKKTKKEDLKEFILQKYMLVDDEDDKKNHRPLMPKEAPKKMIRYIDNQVVSTKGERYKDVKKPESEEMKKTYINLKPARKYKFH